MKSMFQHYYDLTDDDWSELWEKCTFILDTNALLNLYRYSKSTSDDLLRILNEVADRLWIPHQVALEYQENRSGLTIEQLNKYAEVENILSEVKGNLRERFSELKLDERHYSIDPSNFIQQVEATIDRFSKDLQVLRNLQPQQHAHVL